MKVLVLSVDRDNDFGRKANVASPIIGRENNVNAAVALGTKDPEDSDSNAVLAAISVYDELAAMGQDAEVATICGDLKVGIFSDSILAKQLESVIEATGAASAVLVTDGSEDEYILPIIQSRLKIDSIKKITMKQTQNIQDTFYMLRKLLDDEKIQRKFVIPISIALAVLGIAALFNQMALGFGAMLIIMALYLFEKTVRVSDRVKTIAHERITLAVFLIAIGLIAVGGITTYIHIMDVQTQQGFPATRIQTVALIAEGMAWWAVASVLTITTGRVIDALIMEKSVVGYAATPFTALMFGLIIPAISRIVLSFIEPAHKINISSDLFWIMLGIIFGVVGASIHKFIEKSGKAAEKSK
ncbi:MAG: hypothetical protein CVT47_03140 [Thermoplasmata archaeon HGW-Thermoplasmata-2]|nr:MAG: hypothetical protein CVT47_03140 [Thermoplasmata archaeon HGW-Thermoplasmata-2]